MPLNFKQLIFVKLSKYFLIVREYWDETEEMEKVMTGPRLSQYTNSMSIDEKYMIYRNLK